MSEDENLFDHGYDDEPTPAWDIHPEDEFISDEIARDVLNARHEKSVRAHDRRQRYLERGGGTGGVVGQNVRAEAIGAKGVLVRDQWQAWRECFGGVCAYCGEKPDPEAIEHVVPLSKGGENTIYNVVPACADCNMGKRAKDPQRWLVRTGRLDEFLSRVIAALEAMNAKT